LRLEARELERELLTTDAREDETESACLVAQKTAGSCVGKRDRCGVGQRRARRFEPHATEQRPVNAGGLQLFRVLRMRGRRNVDVRIATVGERRQRCEQDRRRDHFPHASSMPQTVAIRLSVLNI